MYTGEGASESSEMSRARSVDRGEDPYVFVKKARLLLLLKKNLIPVFDVDSSILPFFLEGG